LAIRPQTKEEILTMATSILNVPDISCGHCQATITNALSPLSGVDSVSVDITTKTVTVQYDPAAVGLDQMKDRLAEEDYPVESVA
jgi:copper chaperone